MESSLAGGATASLASGLMDWRSQEGRGVSRGTLRGHLPNLARGRTRLSCRLRIHQPLEKHLQELGHTGFSPWVSHLAPCSTGKAASCPLWCLEKRSR